MKTHRPWQPHMGSSPLFNPFAPSTDRDAMLDQFDIAEEEEEESTDQPAAEQADQPPTATKQD